MVKKLGDMNLLNYEKYDRLPVVHFGYWEETLEKWCLEGHLTREEIDGLGDGNEKDRRVGDKIGFDFNWFTTFMEKAGFGSLMPVFERKVVEELPDGMRKIINEDGVIVMDKPGVRSIASEVDHLLKDRASWEEHYLPRLQYSPERTNREALQKVLDNPDRENPLGLYCGSLFGQIRN
jgi:uroporphyrinogen decarboxylase